MRPGLLVRDAGAKKCPRSSPGSLITGQSATALMNLIPAKRREKNSTKTRGIWACGPKNGPRNWVPTWARNSMRSWKTPAPAKFWRNTTYDHGGCRRAFTRRQILKAAACFTASLVSPLFHEIDHAVVDEVGKVCNLLSF